MAESLRDQLLKAGLVDSSKAKKAAKAQARTKAEEHSRKARRRKSGKAVVETDSAAQLKAEAQRLRAEKAERDRELNARREAKARAKALTAEILQLIEANREDRKAGELVFRFVENKKIKQVYVNGDQRERLSAGRAAIVGYRDRHEMIPVDVAEKIRARNDRWFVSIVVPETVAEDDPYADYQIPDDLDW